jgi:D-alanine--poly(phosphoribitol) ligase subunit 2
MNRQERIVSVLRRVSGQDVSLPAADSLFESGILDSFALPELVSALEQEFSISIPDSDLTPRKFESIERIDEYVGARA